MPEVLDISDALLRKDLPKEERRRHMRQVGERALHWWETRQPYRTERAEARNYWRGRQYEALIKNDQGEWVTEKTYIESQNRIAIVMNMVANIVNNVHGQFLNNKSERAVFAVEREAEQEVRAMNLARRYMRRTSKSSIIEADEAREHFLSGASAFRSEIVWRPKLNRHEVRDTSVNQTRLFFNLDLNDRRADDLSIVGELHDVSRPQAYQQFARSRRDKDRIDALLGARGEADGFPDGRSIDGFGLTDSLNFFQPSDPSKHRIIQCWTPIYQWVRFGYDPLFVETSGYEEIRLPDNQITRIQNERRELGLPLLELDEKKYEPVWHYFFFNADFEVFQDPKPTPYWHGDHPYTLGLAMLFDGETWGIVNNIKDPQRLTNRIISQIDHSMGVGAKGALGLDEDVLDLSTMSEEEIADNYSRADGLVKLRLGGRNWDQAIRQLQSQPLQGGHFQLLPLLLTFTEKISGLPEAAQGFTPKAGTPAALYDRQVRQASINAMPYLQSFFDTLRMKDVKEIQLIQQAVSDEQYFRGERPGEESVRYDPDAVRDVLMDVAIGEVTDTVTHREQQEAFWLNLVQTGAMPLEIYLALSSNPRAQEALDMITQLGQLATSNATQA
jgi:hypothetical protein